MNKPLNIEHEIKLLGANIEKIQEMLDQENIAVDSTLSFRRVVFDTIPALDSAWIRLRSDGKNTTLTYKNSQSDAIDGMQEVEVEVSDFEKTEQILNLAGLKSRNYQENERIVYYAYDCMITIDYWPQIPPYVEIEGPSTEVVEGCLRKFDGLYERTTSQPTEAVYTEYGINLRNIDSLTFEK